MTASPCPHTHQTSIRIQAFTDCIATHPFTGCDPVAHGGHVRIEECGACGAQRSVARNAGHEETGMWKAVQA